MILVNLLLSFAFSEIKQPIHKVIIRGGDEGSQFYRIPAIVVAPDNKTLVTATDKRWTSHLDLPRKIDTVIKISKDNGLTWTNQTTISPGRSDPKGYGDPALVVDHVTKAIFCLFTGLQGTFESTKDDRQHIYYCVSFDNGETWSPMEDITNMLYGTGCKDPIRKEYYSTFITSGNGVQLRNGRLMFVGAGRRDSSRKTYDFAVYSDDHGKTWTMSPWSPTNGNGDESKIVELNNGSLLMSIRNQAKKNRKNSLSIDGGLTWSPPVIHPDLVDPACNGDIIRYTSTKDGFNKDRLLHSLDFHPTSRQNLSVLVSYDEGNTWPVQKVICPGPSVYSSITFSPIDGTIFLYWENGTSNMDMTVTTLTLDYLTDGKDTWTPPNKK
ncbi:hypothetical protein M9Y10_032155 [Tritrichomonas musculus]|uniref:Sialidase domain-containing protein n=1 Tax=Tritrichomonas musculus TaxID=1915356 RepID=A0ABR2H037_9EUKA